MNDSKEFLDANEAIEHLAKKGFALSFPTFLKIRDSEGIPFYPLGAKIRYKPADLDAFVESRRTVATAAAALDKKEK